MDSLPLHASVYDPLFPGPTYSDTRRRRSTSQMCLQRILTVIATVAPPLLPAENSPFLAECDTRCVNKRSGFDSNSPEKKESLCSSSTAGEGSDIDQGGDREERSLTLLIEATKLIFGEFMDDEKSEMKERNGLALKNDDVATGIETGGGKLGRPSRCRAAVEIGGEFEESTPSSVARSKRVRNRVLPCRYRDSVLEPSNWFSRTASSILPVKRRRR